MLVSLQTSHRLALLKPPYFHAGEGTLVSKIRVARKLSKIISDSNCSQLKIKKNFIEDVKFFECSSWDRTGTVGFYSSFLGRDKLFCSSIVNSSSALLNRVYIIRPNLQRGDQKVSQDLTSFNK